MIRDQQEGSIVRSGLDVLEAVDVHDVVSREMDPAGAEGALTPCPKSLPGALIHAPHKAKSETFKGRKNVEITQSTWLIYLRAFCAFLWQIIQPRSIWPPDGEQ